MGSLKDEMRGLREDHQPREKPDDGEGPGGSQGSVVPEGRQISASQESTSEGDKPPELHVNASFTEETAKKQTSKDRALSTGVCDTTMQSDSAGAMDSMQAAAIPLIQSPEADETTAATYNDATVSTEVLGAAEGGNETEEEALKDKNMDTEDGEKESDIQDIFVPVPVTPGPYDLRSPAPDGQHHMRTQVSLEVVQCRSAATSPMTPPEGGHSFFFPSSFGRSEAVGSDTKDAELQVGQQVELCSVATSPMTPKTPFSFPEPIRREAAQKSEGKRKEVEVTIVKEESENSGSCPATGFTDSQAMAEDSNQHCKQPRMGSMDQDITILVTHCDNNEEEEKEEEESSCCPTDLEMVKIDEQEELEESNGEVQRADGKQVISTEAVALDPAPANTNPPQNKGEEAAGNSSIRESDESTTRPIVPESPAPFGCHSIRTQVSLEVVQCQSVATSPMTPPDGEHTFYFPSNLGRSAAAGTETKDAELQVGPQVEVRSVATAPMTPRTPISTTFPEMGKEVSTEEKIVEETESKKKLTVEGEGEEVKREEEKNCKEKCEEPVQEVSWDEKGMTWEVYGAVVEVTVLGSAIQKHLEKQVKKRQPSMPPPPPLNPSAVPLGSDGSQRSSAKGKRGAERDREASRRRRNPFRLMMKNMQQPHCCSKAHTTE